MDDIQSSTGAAGTQRPPVPPTPASKAEAYALAKQLHRMAQGRAPKHIVSSYADDIRRLPVREAQRFQAVIKDLLNEYWPEAEDRANELVRAYTSTPDELPPRWDRYGCLVEGKPSEVRKTNSRSESYPDRYTDHYAALLFALAERLSSSERPPGEAIRSRLSPTWQKLCNQKNPLQDWLKNKPPELAEAAGKVVQEAIDQAARHETPATDYERLELEAARTELEESWGGRYDRSTKGNPVFVPTRPKDLKVMTAAVAIAATAAIGSEWLWPDWIRRGALHLLLGREKAGKSFVLLDLARRLWFGLALPDGTPSSVPSGARTLWILADRKYEELAGRLAGFGLPAEAVLFGDREQLGDGLRIDDPATVKHVGLLARFERPALVVIDTMSRAIDPRRPLHSPEAVGAVLGPWLSLAQETGTPVVAVDHLNKAGAPLHQRIVGAAQVVLQVEEPDSVGEPGRKRLWVEASSGARPAPLGVTLSDAGAEYDHSPPNRCRAASTAGGRPPDRRQSAVDFLHVYLAEGPKPPSEVEANAAAIGIAHATLHRARNMAGVVTDGRLWRLAQG